jgi:hypothetical protein
MRPTPATFGLWSLLLLSGCQEISKHMHLSSDPGVLPGRTPAPSELVAHLNESAQRLKSLTCQDVDIEFTQDFQSVGGIRGRLACEQPRNFRLTAMMVKSTELDLGSNDREFWFWIARAKPPYQFFCSYEDLSTKQIRLPFPFQPEWVMETLGMTSFPVDGNYKVQPVKNTIELIQDTTSLQGQPVQKVIVFSRDQTRILEYKLRDLTGKEICSAQIRDVQKLDGATVPHAIQLNWPSERIKLGLTLKNPKPNQLSLEMAQFIFQRPHLKDIESYNLAHLSPEGNGAGQVERAGTALR